MRGRHGSEVQVSNYDNRRSRRTISAIAPKDLRRRGGVRWVNVVEAAMRAAAGPLRRVGSAWTDSGGTHDERHLKHRSRKTTRPVPIPPELVKLLRAHLSRFGAAPDGRLFRGARGAMLSESSYGRIWQQAREKALAPGQSDTPLAGRPYDLRHSGVTLGLNAGVPAPEVARRAGHSVVVLLRVYAGCIDGHEQFWNSRIDDALRDETGG